VLVGAINAPTSHSAMCTCCRLSQQVVNRGTSIYGGNGGYTGSRVGPSSSHGSQQPVHAAGCARPVESRSSTARSSCCSPRCTSAPPAIRADQSRFDFRQSVGVRPGRKRSKAALAASTVDVGSPPADDLHATGKPSTSRLESTLRDAPEKL